MPQCFTTRLTLSVRKVVVRRRMQAMAPTAPLAARLAQPCCCRQTAPRRAACAFTARRPRVQHRTRLPAPRAGLDWSDPDTLVRALGRLPRLQWGLSACGYLICIASVQ